MHDKPLTYDEQSRLIEKLLARNELHFGASKHLAGVIASMKDVFGDILSSGTWLPDDLRVWVEKMAVWGKFVPKTQPAVGR